MTYFYLLMARFISGQNGFTVVVYHPASISAVKQLSWVYVEQGTPGSAIKSPKNLKPKPKKTSKSPKP